MGTWVKDRYGAVHQRRTYDGTTGWGEPGTMPFGKWESMWNARGPLVECGPWGRELPSDSPTEPLAKDP